MKRAAVLLRTSLHYRRDAFCEGLRALGYGLIPTDVPLPNKFRPDDILVVWNRYGGYDETAKQFEAAGARVVVVENGYLGKDWRGGDWYSMALGHHLGAGRWPVGGPERWSAIGCELQPWKTGGSEILVFEQRGIGERGLASPHGWAQRAVSRIGRSARIRPHPGPDKPKIPLAVDLEHCQAVATWASSAALHALIAGVPVWYEMPKWIGAGASRFIGEFTATAEPLRDDNARLAMFERLAWSVWNLEEIRSGAALANLLQ